ncbi:MAG TPA: hypothetical protein VKA46_33100 [Gemmataceae bacterium]|nr:hypothetical protein [Gemmataceae bacterium]
MRFSWRHLLALLLIGAAGLLACLPGPARAVGEGGEEPEPSRRLPARWRDDPTEYRRLKDEWKAFHKLPRERQDRLRQIDEELNDEPPAVRARLWGVLDRYVVWLERLDEKDRREIESAPDPAKRLEIIKGLREREWVAHLPKTEREQIDQASPETRAKLIEQFRQKERHRRAEWQAALRLQDEVVPPRGQPDFWPDVQRYLNRSLRPTLPHTERDKLDRAARGPWPEYAQQITALADEYPIHLPPGERPGVINFKDLTECYTGGRPAKLRPRELGGQLGNLQGRWPQFALAIDRLVKSKKIPAPDKPLGPCKPEEFLPAVQRFIEELRKDSAAAKKLDETQGKWPDYPFAVMELAKEKKRKVPGTFLPGPKEFWDKAKAGQAE